MMFRICVIGCGSMSTYAHGPSCARYAARHQDVELAACCDLDEGKAAEYAKIFGFTRPYTDLAKMIDTERPDAVCLIAPVDLTCELACRVMQMGCPLIMEKPPGMTVQETDRMIAEAEASGALNQVAFNRRYAPVVRELKGLLDREFAPSGLQHIQYEMTRVGRADADFSTTASHGVDAAKFLAGSDYKSITLRYKEFPDLGPTTANIIMDCVFESGATGTVTFCPVAGRTSETAAVYAYNHTFEMSLPMFGEFEPNGFLRHFEAEKLVYDVTSLDLTDSAERFVLSGFYDENASFFDDLRAGRRPVGDLRSARQSVAVMQCIRERKTEYVKPK